MEKVPKDEKSFSLMQQSCFRLNAKIGAEASENANEEYSRVLLSRYEQSVALLLPVLYQETRNQNQQATFFTNKTEFTSYAHLLPPDDIKQQLVWTESNNVLVKKEIEGPVKKTKFNEPTNNVAPVPTAPKYLVTPPIVEEKVQLKKREPIKDTSYINYGDREEEIETEEPTSQTPFITARQKLEKDNETKNGGSAASKGTNVSKTSKSSVGGGKRKFVTPFKDKQEEEEPPKQQNKKPNQNSNTKEKNPLLNDERLKGCEEAMVEMICNDIIDKSPCISWNDIAGLEHAKSTVHEMIIYPLLRPDIFTGIRAPPKGLLLFGPPGTGKTMIGKAIASESKSTFFSISASSLTSKWIGEGEKMVRTMFAVARCLQPVVIFIDEIDSLLTQRSDNENEASRRIKTEFLIQLDGAGNGAEERLLLIGATNRPQELDEAARRRLVKKLYIPLPELSARVALLTSLLSKCPHTLNEEDIHNVAVKCEGFSGADLKSLAQEAALYAVREEINILEVSSLRPVNANDFFKAIRHTKPSVSQDSLKQYEDWNKQFGSFV